MSLCQQALILAYMCVLLISSCNSGGAQVCAMYGFGDTATGEYSRRCGARPDTCVPVLHLLCARVAPAPPGHRCGSALLCWIRAEDSSHGCCAWSARVADSNA
eukprot:6253069-Prymnesium_polylepis.1